MHIADNSQLHKSNLQATIILGNSDEHLSAYIHNGMLEKSSAASVIIFSKFEF